MTMKMVVGGLVGMMSLTAFVAGCSGGSVSSPPDDPSGDNTPSQASLPNKTDSAPSKGTPGAGGTQTPAGSPAQSPSNPASPSNPSNPAQPGDPASSGQPGMSGTVSNGNSCCYNNTELSCDATQCFGGYDEEACEAKCSPSDFDCQIACVDALGSAGPPTAKCKPTGNKC